MSFQRNSQNAKVDLYNGEWFMFFWLLLLLARLIGIKILRARKDINAAQRLDS